MAASTTYGYRVRALNGAGASACSNFASAGTLAAAGGIPTSGLAFWLKADAGVTPNGSTVSQLAEQSGNGRHAAQVTVSSQPLWTSSGLQFDGVNDFLSFNLPING